MWRLHTGKPVEHLTRGRPAQHSVALAPLTWIHTLSSSTSQISDPQNQWDNQERTKQVPSLKRWKQENTGFSYLHIGGNLVLRLLPFSRKSSLRAHTLHWPHYDTIPFLLDCAGCLHQVRSFLVDTREVQCKSSRESHVVLFHLSRPLTIRDYDNSYSEVWLEGKSRERIGNWFSELVWYNRQSILLFKIWKLNLLRKN